MFFLIINWILFGFEVDRRNVITVLKVRVPPVFELRIP